ncbi:amidohydrolase family protein [Fulvivirga ligni]|uniref:amidohydrolase family protein n=1 Tax=Fulvivirga ligni TaxID=2904246 RepID=UPI001F1803DD|nr:amidohydrolase family protein [Fulvivirga ligni]UII19655.1 amidohydrolase family protein [Fulvivirga ligni]
MTTKDKKLKIITTEEHFATKEISAYYIDQVKALNPHFQDAYSINDKYSPSLEQIADLADGRIADMDKHGIDMQVLSYTSPGLQMVAGSEAAHVAKKANDLVGTAMKNYPDRFSGFASLPTADVKAAVYELERCVNELGMNAAIINGRTNNLFLDHPSFEPILATAEKLETPIYIHPVVPPKAVYDTYFDGLDPLVSARFSTAGWGWHNEAGIHGVRMMAAGVFDKYPNLQIILGHWGEMATFYLERISNVLTPVSKNLDRSYSEYFQNNFYITPSGMFSVPSLLHSMQIIGADRILYAVDYPYVPHDGARAFLENAPISEADKHKIGYQNVESLLKLKF